MTAALARLRKKAAELEQKKQFDKALEVYMQILDEGGKDLEDEDVPLFNRVGDMLTRKGRVSDALGYYERAVDVYAERGYLNNAIALCSKILRQSPGRATVYYKLARISARKGFRSDARKNFLEYADRMQKAGQSEEAFRALKEFASLYPDQDDVRLILAELLSKENRKGEALEQLQSLYAKLQSEGRAAEARATVDRMRAIDPEATPTVGTAQPTPAAGDLVFLDLTDSEGPRITPRQDTPQPVSARAPVPTPLPALTGLNVTFLPDDDDATRVEEHQFAPPESEEVAIVPEEPAPVELELNEVADVDLIPDVDTMGAEASTEPAASLSDDMLVEPIDPIELPEGSPPHIERIEQEIEDLASSAPPPASSGTPRSVTPLSVYEFADIDLDEVRSQPPDRQHDLALPLEMNDAVDEPDPAEDSVVAPEVLSTAPPLTFESAAASEDARAAAEEAAAIAADIALREAVQPISATWSTPTQPPVPNGIVEAEGGSGVGETGAPPTFEPATEAVEEVQDDFLSQPPSFGAPTSPSDDHAFPPIDGLDDSGQPPESAGTPEAPQAAIPTPRGTISIGSAESHLRSRIELDPENWDLHRQLGEALLDTGDRDGGLYELELAMAGFEMAEELDRAQEIVDEILRVTPGSVAHHQKRVEFAVKSRDRNRLANSYLELADALFRSGAADKAVAVYGRVLELDRDNERAEFALLTLAPDQLAKLRGSPARTERWSDELAAIGRRGGDPGEVPLAAEPAVGVLEVESPTEPAREEYTPDLANAVSAPPPPPPASPSNPRARFASIELPIPDWGEGSPVHTPALDDRAEPREEAAEQVPAALLEDVVDRDAGSMPADELHEVSEQAAEHEGVRTPTPLGARAATPPAQPEIAIAPTPTPASPERIQTPLATLRVPTPAPPPRIPTPLATPRVPTPAPPPRIPTPLATPRVPTPRANPRTPTPWSVPVPDTSPSGGSDDFVDLGEWLRNTEPARSTRMQVEDPQPTGDEQADFQEMLRRFKRGVAENVEAEDYDAHYDLGVAYKEMGLVDEAIAQFQRALKGPTQRVRSYEALGQCFVEKQQYPIAAALLQRATEVPGSDDQQLVGVLYLLGFAMEHMGRPQEALPYYLRVFAVDIEFRDIAGRVAALGNGIK